MKNFPPITDFLTRPQVAQAVLGAVVLTDWEGPNLPSLRFENRGHWDTWIAFLVTIGVAASAEPEEYGFGPA